MKEREIMKKEAEFLNWCGFDTSNGFWQDDVNIYKKLYPHQYNIFLSGW
tara:strand:- start:661 stop:807 length:147 start_codon:yes stop_codon:yes gene_type:complete